MTKCTCGGKYYAYGGIGIKILICYRCGKFDCKVKGNNDQLTAIFINEPELVLELIRVKYLQPII